MTKKERSMPKGKDKKPDKEPDSVLKEVSKVWGPVEAEVIKTYLKSHGIPCLLRGQVVQSIHPFSMDGLGEIKIFVQEKHFDLAKKLLESRDLDQEKEAD
jgi:hypothetical protein